MMEHFHLIEDFLGISVTDAMKESVEIEKLAVEHVASMQPLEALPGWFLPSVTTSKSKRPDGIWVVTFDVFTKRHLQSGEQWVERHGHRTVARLDPETGKETLELHGTCGQQRITLFKVEVDLLKRECVMVKQSDLSRFDENEIEITKCDLPNSPPPTPRD